MKTLSSSKGRLSNVLCGTLQFFVTMGGAFAGQDETEPAKKTQNPVSDLISVPLQSNSGTVSKERTVHGRNVQPVIPIKLNENWNFITRWVTPIINQPSLFSGIDSAAGIGDINRPLFLSRAKAGGSIWGIGPTFTLPTASDSLLGSGKWSTGPTGVILKTAGPWVFGALINNQWSLGGWGNQNVNAMLLQPVLNYKLPHGWYFTSSPIATANWKADKDGDVWNVPVGAGVGKLFRLGPVLPLEGNPIATLPINTQLVGFGNVA